MIRLTHEGGVNGAAGDAMGLSARTVAITAQSNAYRGEASSQSSSPASSMSCRTSTALRTTARLILKFFLPALFRTGARWLAFTPPPGSMSASISRWRLFKKPTDYVVTSGITVRPVLARTRETRCSSPSNIQPPRRSEQYCRRWYLGRGRCRRPEHRTQSRRRCLSRTKP